MKRFIFALACLSLVAPSYADSPETDEYIVGIWADTRLDWQGHWLDGDNVKGDTGFKGKYVNLHVDGNITDNLSYSWRQRFNKPHKDASFFDATDWIYLNYTLGNWQFAGGKQVVAIGGWEYDRAPINLYGCSVFWNNIPCYEIGGSVAYNVTPDDRLTLQFCESPFYQTDNTNMYAYNLMWNGSHGIFKAIYSANLIEYMPGRFINYLALGNKFTVDKLSLELDIMNRASSHQKFLFKDMSVMAELSFRPNGKWNIFGKMTYDVNKSGTAADATVLNGTEMKMAGAGVEFTPFENKHNALRFHATGFYSWGTNSNTADVMQNKTLTANLGVTWSMDFLALKRK